MGISLHNIGKKIGDVLGGVERQINPFDNGATYSNPNPAPPPRTALLPPAPVANPFQNNQGPVPGQPNMPAPGSFFNQLDAPNNPTPVVKPKRTAVPTPNTLQPGINTGPLLGNNSPVQLGKVGIKPAPIPVGPESSTTPLDIARSFITQPAAEIATSAISAIPGFRNTSYTPGSGVEKALFGKQPIKSGQQDVAGTYQAVKAGHQNLPGGIPISPKLAVPYAAAAAVLHVAQDLPLVGGIVRGLTGGAKVTLKGADAAAAAKPTVKAAEVATGIKDGTSPTAEAAQVAKLNAKLAPEVTPTERATATAAAQGAPTAQIATAAPVIPKTSMPTLDKAIQDVSAEYATKANHAPGAPIQDIVGTASNQSTIAGRVTGRLRKALSSNLSKAENTQVRDILDGHPGAWEAATPKAQEAANALKPLHDQAFGLRQAIDPRVNRIQDYVTRLPSRAVGATVKGASDVMGKIRNLSDITNLKSVFSMSRQDGKFIDNEGNAIHGNPKTLGLTQHNDGTITDAAGKEFKRTAVSTQQLSDATGKQYENQISRLQGIYHTDTLSLKARAEALQALNKDPASHGLYTQEEVDAGALGGRGKAYAVDSVDELRTPEGKPYYAAKDDAQALSDTFGHPTLDNTPRVLKAYDVASNVAQQSIVINFLIHTMNEFNNMISAAGNLPGLKGLPGHGVGRVLKNVIDQNEGDIRDFLANSRNHSSTFGSTMENALSRATNGKSKFNSKLMAAIELRFRTALYKSSLEKNMSPKAAADNVNLFFGDKKAINETVRRTVLFPHFLKTQAKIIGTQVRHPIQQRGSIVNTVALAGAIYGLDKAYQDFTGNPNANIGPRGELSLIKQGAGIVKGVINKDPSAVVSSVLGRANPVGKEIAQQASNTDFFTGKHVSEAPGGRLGHLASSTLAPVDTGSRVAAGKKSLAEMGLNQLNLNTPHAKGYQAAPNLTGLNTKGAIISPKGDPTGYQQQAAYFKGLAAAKKAVAGDTASTDALTKYLGRSHDPNTGQSIKNSPSESLQNSAALATNDKLRNTVQKFEKSQSSHDPMWDLPADQLKALMQYKEQFTGSPDKTFYFLKANSPDGSSNWIKDIEAKQKDYYASLKSPGGALPPEDNPQTPKYPQFDTFTQALLDKYDTGTSQDKTALLQNYGPQLSDAWQQKGDWTNAMRRAEGAPELKGYPKADPETQAILATYNALPQHDGSKGGNATRYAWGQANPAAYAKMQDYLSQAAMSSLVKNASLDQFQGADANQALLKDIKNIGQYDIAVTKNADGTKSYALNPSAAAAAYANSYASSYSGSGYSKTGAGKGNPASRQAYRDNKKMSYYAKIPKIGAKIKRPSVKLSKGSSSVKFKGSTKIAKSSKVALKPSKV